MPLNSRTYPDLSVLVKISTALSACLPSKRHILATFGIIFLILSNKTPVAQLAYTNAKTADGYVKQIWIDDHEY